MAVPAERPSGPSNTATPTAGTPEAGTAATRPTEGRCDHCKQTRPLFEYQPDPHMHLTGAGMGCEWCNRDTQPKLCVPCFDKEAERESNDPVLMREAGILADICANNRRADEVREARKAAGR